MIKLIMSDMDGTLLDENGLMPPGLDEILAELKKRGVIFAPASGRQYYSLADSFAAHLDDLIFIAENGTMVKRRGKEIFSHTMPKDLAYEALAAMADRADILSVYCGKKQGYIRAEQNTPAFVDELTKYYTVNGAVTDFQTVEDEPIKISFFDPTGQSATSIYPLMQRFAGPLQVTLASQYWVDLTAVGANKGHAVQELQVILGLKPEECAAFGDYMNDAEMMGAVHYSYAMANAHPELKKLARFEAKSNAQHGVILAIRELIDRGLCGEVKA